MTEQTKPTSDSHATSGAGDDPGGVVTARPESAATLRRVAAMVRRIMQSDTASVASISLEEGTITWRATSGFRSRADDDAREVTHPLRGIIGERTSMLDELLIIEAVGLESDLPPSEFPMHSGEDVRDMALVPLRADGEIHGLLAVGYRKPHRFTANEKQLLEGLAEVVELALENARLLETVATGKKVWEQTFDAIPDGIIVHDDRMSIVRCNTQAAFMMGFERPAEVVGMACPEAFARLFGERAAAYHMKQTADTTSSFELQAEDGRRYLVSIAPLQAINRAGAGEAGWSVITWSDITELSEVQEQLARSRRLATVGQLAAGVAHEINNPLAAITTCAEAVQRGIRMVPEVATVAEERNWNFYLDEIVRQALRCKSITRGLLDLSRQRRARREPCDLNALVKHSVALFEQRGHMRGIAFSLNLDERVGELATDEAMIRQILDNLLTNALDAVDEGGRINVSTTLDGERIIVEVADDGPGITPGVLAHVFDPFFTTKDPGHGSGLGLAISLTLAETIGGALTVESKPGAGSRFRLWIPRRTPEKEEQK